MEKAKRPKTLGGPTERMLTGCGHLYVTLNFDKNKPFEVFCSLGKEGGCAAAYAEALSRSISLGLRYHIPIDEYIHQFSGIHCPNRSLEDGIWIESCPDAVSKSLEKRMEEQENIEEVHTIEEDSF